jgi:hypothetical protein
MYALTNVLDTIETSPAKILCMYGKAETYEMHEVYLEPLDRLEKSLELEAWQHYYTITPVYTGVDHDDERVDVRHGQQTDRRLRLDAILLPSRVLVPPDLHYVGNDVAVRDHDGFLCVTIFPLARCSP